MNQLVRTPLESKQCPCRSCCRLSYVNARDPNDPDLDFGLPCGCDDNGPLVRRVNAEQRGMTDVPVGGVCHQVRP